MFINSKTGFNQETIQGYNKIALGKIIEQSEQYFLGDSKKIELFVLLDDENSLILSQTFSGGTRIFNINKQSKHIIITENSMHKFNNETLLSGDFTDTVFVYYGVYSI